ncbi:PREDICTED: spermatogenesis-associated protein 16-like, partial [Fulmarus glacialis]|uniref:spermatogenesis-associated protein 16-like n=1 Tax=Fulmarus glacialis TaxID=30455 RepID=UPI00051B3BA2
MGRLKLGSYRCEITCVVNLPCTRKQRDQRYVPNGPISQNSSFVKRPSMLQLESARVRMVSCFRRSGRKGAVAEEKSNIGLCLCKLSGEEKSPLIFLEGSSVLYGCSEENSCKLVSDDSFFTQVMTSESNADFQQILISMDGKNETSQQMRSSKESNAAANKSNDVPEALQEVSGDGAAENIMERIKMAEKKKDKQSNDVDRTSRKRKSENNEKLAVTQEETTLETGNQLIPTPLSHIPLKSLTDIEMELVYTDEEDIPFEFAGPVVPTSTQSACRDSEKAKALSALNGSALPQINKQLQMTLREASACYRQKNYAAAAERFSTALELCSKGVAIEKPFESSPEDISSIASFIETKLVTCYLKLMKPDDALNHSHRSIILNPAYFRNHLRQAAVFRCLERYSEAA